MDSSKKARLLDKYWKGNTSLSEEKALLKQMESIENLSEEESAYFKQIQQFSQLSLDEEFSISIIQKTEEKKTDKTQRILPPFYLRIAAAILLFLSLIFLFFPYQKTEEPPLLAMEEDPKKAFEITKQALLLVSAKLNKASEVTVALDKFNEVQDRIKIEKSKYSPD